MNVKRIWHKIKAVPLIGVPYEKLIGRRKVAKLRARSQEELQKSGMSYIKIVEDTLRPTGAVYFAYAGTLLGIARERKLLSWDLDMDYAVVITPEFTWEDLEKTLTAAGFRKSREFTYNGMITEQSYRLRSMDIDFFGFFPQGDKMLSYSSAYIPGENYSDPDEQSLYVATLPYIHATTSLVAGDVAVTVPEDCESFLANLYDENWRIPNPNWVANTGKSTSLVEGARSRRQLF